MSSRLLLQHSLVQDGHGLHVSKYPCDHTLIFWHSFFIFLGISNLASGFYPSFSLSILDKESRLDVENAVNPLQSDEDKKLVVVKTPNAVNPLVWNYYHVSSKDYIISIIHFMF